MPRDAVKIYTGAQEDHGRGKLLDADTAYGRLATWRHELALWTWRVAVWVMAAMWHTVSRVSTMCLTSHTTHADAGCWNTWA